MPDSTRATSGLQQMSQCQAFAGARFVLLGSSWMAEQNHRVGIELLRVYLSLYLARGALSSRPLKRPPS